VLAVVTRRYRVAVLTRSKQDREF